MATRVDRAGFQSLFTGWTTSAWRLETQFVYHEPDEVEPLRRYLDGELDLDWLAEWFGRVRGWRARGRTFERVRVLSEPLTDYLRFELAITPSALDAGEDIRLLSQGVAERLALGTSDFWLFDDKTVVLMDFDDNGVCGADVITEPDEVVHYRAIRDRAWAHAVPAGEHRKTKVQRGL
ncbi:DUF6879 family protein [Allokutzneria sp. NRRL B-24872]|uniref:DUF6879 family protein n=1 Tax=Allokutzneria sp. NRRL B-24872 TaxID=1137961 RepID=UPI00143CC5E8|nr:DUF6879 family protein [Allokutzneria sp. NRRL B-24872]